jgi:hypothetical protein
MLLGMPIAPVLEPHRSPELMHSPDPT